MLEHFCCQKVFNMHGVSSLVLEKIGSQFESEAAYIADMLRFININCKVYTYTATVIILCVWGFIPAYHESYRAFPWNTDILQSKSVHFFNYFFLIEVSQRFQKCTFYPTLMCSQPTPPEHRSLLCCLRNYQIGFQYKSFQEWVSELAVWNLYVFLVRPSSCHLFLFFEKETFLLKGRWLVLALLH